MCSNCFFLLLCSPGLTSRTDLVEKKIYTDKKSANRLQTHGLTHSKDEEILLQLFVGAKINNNVFRTITAYTSKLKSGTQNYNSVKLVEAVLTASRADLNRVLYGPPFQIVDATGSGHDTGIL